MNPKKHIFIFPLFFFIFWESGAIHSLLGLVSPLYMVKIVSALSLSMFVLFANIRKPLKTLLTLLLFFLPFFVFTVAPYLFMILTFAYLLSRNVALLKGTLILLPLTIFEGLGSTLPLWLIIFLTFLLYACGSMFRDNPTLRMKHLSYYGLACLFSILLLTSFTLYDPFAIPKNKVVAYDNYHSASLNVYFENDTIIHSTLRYIDSIGYNSSIIDEPISAKTLRGISVLIINTPVRNFSSIEIDHLARFVEEGGGLFVLGDHTNVQNCYVTLNPLVDRFSVKLNFDYSILWEPHFSSIAGFDSYEETAGATISVNTWDGIIFYSLKYTTWADQGNWSAPDNAFIGNLTPEEHEEYGFLPICATVNYGEGRVIVISNGDSMNGVLLLHNHKFLASVIDYLNHKNSFIRTFYFRILILPFILFGIVKLRLSFIPILLVALLLTLLLLQIYALIPMKSLPENNLIALDTGHANVESYGPPHLYKNIFFVVFAQHYGLNPVLVDNIPGNLERCQAYITMGPTLPFSKEETDRLKEFVENGGLLIVFDGYHAETSTKTSNDAGNSLLKGFEISLSGQLLGETSYSENTTWNYGTAYRINATVEAKPTSNKLMGGVNGSITMYSATEVQGGTPIAAYNDKPVIAIKNVGKGYVLVIGDHTIFRNVVEYKPVFHYLDLNLKQFIENIFTSLGGKEQFGA